MDFIIKSYPTGKASKALGTLKEGDSIEVKGPYSKYAYEPNMWSHVGLIGGGTGITPMYQLIREVLANPRDHTQITLLYASRTPEDIILKAELDALAVVHPNFKVIYTVSASPYEEGTISTRQAWKGPTGHITKEMITAHFPSPAQERVKIMICGPPPMYRAYSGEKKSPSDQGELTGVLAELGYNKEQVFKY